VTPTLLPEQTQMLNIRRLRCDGWERRMPGDPKECRERAARCRQLASDARSAEAKQHFLALARQWENLAADLDNAQKFIEAMNEIEKGGG
jgi:hypothetical protein